MGVNFERLSPLMERLDLPLGARGTVEALVRELKPQLSHLAEVFSAAFSLEDTEPLVQALAEQRGVSPYSLWLTLFLLTAEQARPCYRDDQVFYDTFADLRYKALECHTRYGVWGTFVPHWYPRFYRGNIVKLGRMEYERRLYGGTEPASLMGLTLNPGDPLLYLHIPSSGEPFDLASRLDSYRRAAAYFGGPLICACSSWLLWPDYASLLPARSNIADFRKDFRLIQRKEQDQFKDGWRVFGAAWDGPLAQLPEESRLQRAFKRHLLFVFLADVVWW